MAVNVGLNGYGRIGSIAVRIIAENPDKFNLCGINLRNADLNHMVYATKYDSTFGRFKGTVEAGDGCLVVNGKRVRVFSESDPALIDWASCGAEYIVESTGQFTTAEKAAAHFKAGAKKVLLSAPAKDKGVPTFVYGVNHTEYKKEYTFVSGASCTTNCLAPMAKVINDKFGIERGLITTIHAATAKQKVVDCRILKDYRTGRTVFNNIIPTTTGAAKAVGLVIPELQGRLTGMAMRVPTSDVSVVDLTAQLKTPTDYKSVCAAMKEASETYLKGVVFYTEDPVVSSDFVGETCPCIFDATAGIMLDSTFVKLIAWYDNEYGYTSKLLSLLEHMAKVDAE